MDLVQTHHTPLMPQKLTIYYHKRHSNQGTWPLPFSPCALSMSRDHNHSGVFRSMLTICDGSFSNYIWRPSNRHCLLVESSWLIGAYPYRCPLKSPKNLEKPVAESLIDFKGTSISLTELEEDQMSLKEPKWA